MLIMVLGTLSIMGLVLGVCNEKDILTITCFVIAEICIIIVSSIALNNCSNNKIPAIEVYRSNTELQITYQDSIPIDSVVVYKNK